MWCLGTGTSVSDTDMSADAFIFMGGTFDPIHNGHLRTALEIKEWAGVEQVYLMPARAPVHKQAPGRTSEQRLMMVKQAVQNEAGLNADEREIRSEQPSYSLLTLQSLREEFGPDRPICMVMGMDSYQTLPSWHGWHQFTDYAHIIVVKRPGYELPEEEVIAEFTQQHKTEKLEDLFSTAAGRVIFHELTPLGISATQIRGIISRGESARYLLPDSVYQFILENRLYGLDDKQG